MATLHQATRFAICNYYHPKLAVVLSARSILYRGRRGNVDVTWTKILEISIELGRYYPSTM